MRAHVPALAASLLPLLLAGCSGASPPQPDRAASRAGHFSDLPAAWRPYQLYTHCGINNERVGGRWYMASPRNFGNPPAGWGNPYQPGSIRLLSSTTAQFRDAAGHVVLLVLRRGATGPTFICE